MAEKWVQRNGTVVDFYDYCQSRRLPANHDSMKAYRAEVGPVYVPKHKRNRVEDEAA